jgi:thiosulfate dehydrogenase [quinone] large subunit
MFTRSKNFTGDRSGYSTGQLIALVVLRVAIGWHFLYEGVIKIVNPGWSSSGYLLDSKGWFEGFFQDIAMNLQLLKVVDTLNVWGLTAIGLGLILGLFTRIAIVSGIILLLLYYASHPPLIGLSYALPNEGSYLIVNKTLIEIFALWVLFMFSGNERIGIDRILWNRNKN